MTDLAPLLSNPVIIEPRLVRFASAKPQDDIYLRILLEPDTFFPCVFFYRGVTTLPNMVHSADIADLHPALREINRLLAAQHRGWGTPAFAAILDAAGFAEDDVRPAFPPQTKACGTELLALLSGAFETRLTIQRQGVLRAGPVLRFCGHIVSFLLTLDVNHLADAKKHLPDTHEDDGPFIAQVSDVLQRHGMIRASLQF